MKQGTANLAEDYCFIHKALRPVGTAANCRGAAVKFEARVCNFAHMETIYIRLHAQNIKTVSSCPHYHTSTRKMANYNILYKMPSLAPHKKILIL